MVRAKQRRFRDLVIGLSCVVAAVGAVTAAVLFNIGQIDSEWRSDRDLSQEVALADNVLDAVQDQDNAAQGYLATHDPSFAAPFGKGRERLLEALGRLDKVAEGAGVIDRSDVRQVDDLTREWMSSVAEPLLVAARSGGPAQVPSASAGLVQRLEDALEQLSDHARRALQQKDARLRAALALSRLVLAAGAALALGLASAIFGRTAWQLTRERRLAEESSADLRTALQQAQAGEQAKTRFLANMSHEMRTPLNGVAGLAEALAGTRLDGAQRDMVEGIHFAAATLDHLIGDLLTLAGGGPAEAPANQRFNLRQAARAIALPFMAEAAAKGLALEVEAGPELDSEVTGDAGSLGRVVASLLSNAVKFTDRGSVRLTLRDRGDGRYAFEVADTGVGFDEARLAELFAPFVQSDDGETRAHGGAGLGLTLARRLAEGLGGELEAHSRPGEGSVFSLVVPLGEPAPFAAAAPGSDEAPVRVLIVDDNPTNRRILELILDQVGVGWEEAEDGQQAVVAARRQAFDAILMDIQMPVMDGITATREIRRLEQELGRPATPVIIVSANCRPEHMAAGVAAGAQRHLAKPVSAQTLLGALSDVLADLPQAA